MSATPIVTGRGPQAVEGLLWDELRALGVGGATLPDFSAGPVRVVVPSAPLRLQVAARMVEVLGPAVLGVRVQTLLGLARELLQRAGAAVAQDDALFEVLARRCGRDEALLAQALAAFEDGYGLVASSVRDLLSARLDGERAEAIARGAAVGDSRAAALVRVAIQTRAAMQAHGIGRSGDVLQRAAGCVAAGGAKVVEARAVLIHGFADATGQACAMIAALVGAGARLLIDRPPDPADARQIDAGVVVADRFVARVRGGVAGAEVDAGAPAPSLACFDAAGVESEAGEVAWRVLGLLQAGQCPERIGVVARDLAPYALPLRRQFERRGVPFRGLPAPAGVAVALHRWRPLLELLRRGAEASADVWVEAYQGCAAADDLRIGISAAGAASLEAIAALDTDELLGGRAALPLPTRRGLGDAATTEGDEPAGGDEAPEAEPDLDEEVTALWAARRSLAAEHLRCGVAAARALVEHLRGWGDASLQDHAKLTEAMIADLLGWCADVSREPLEAVVSRRDPALQLTRAEFLALLEQSLEVLAPAAPDGGGVWVLDATHARGLTFDQLYVLGLNRGSFPRVIGGDPLLDDDARRALRAHLPDLALKGEGHDEERYLFAELLSSSSSVAISWQRVDEAGREQSPSPLVQCLLLAHPSMPIHHLPRATLARLTPPHAGGEQRPRTAHELALVAALRGARCELAPLLALQLEDSALLVGDDAAAQARLLAEARLRLFDARMVARTPATGTESVAGLGPFAGAIGPVAEPGSDPRSGPLFVTTLEAFAICPWRTLLQRLLRVALPPDPLMDPPEITGRLIGNTVHRALQQLFAAAGEEGGGGVARVRRPAARDVTRVTQEAAAITAREDGILFAGLHAALAMAAEPQVMRALDIDWPDAASRIAVVGAESERELTVDDGRGMPRRIRFRVDRVDRRDDTIVLSDYKTGAAPKLGKRARTRESRLRERIARGLALQVPAYAATETTDVARAEGRYLFLNPTAEDDDAVVTIDSGDADVAAVLRSTLAELLAGWDEGLFFPRVEDEEGKEPRICACCEMSEACVRGDSEARARLRHLAQRGRSVSASEPLGRLARLWYLGASGGGGGEEGGDAD